ncbi:MAG: TIGR04282 family arsenosugar biosynthesis glycosyltransferase [Pseudomonadota bacterium]|nr:TIGR04282 family arsenosugar biosynthesis glycosyltransferase [Pseudomonadota bacterium]
MNARGRRIAVFTRAPVPGQVKTRLQPALRPEACATLHRALVIRTLETCTRLERVDVELWCTPDRGHAFFHACARDFGIALREQPEGDLGARMYGALADSLARNDQALIIGTDCPELDADYLNRAFDTLSRGRNAVVGRARDGGYVLIGATTARQALFEDVEWGGEQVMDQTRAALRRLGWTWEELAPLRDIDRPEDLIFLPPSLREVAAGRAGSQLVELG